MPSPVASFLADLSRALAAQQVRWYLFGAQAALLYGANRLTADVDVTIHLPGGLDTATLADGLNAHGFRVRIPNPAFIAQTRVIPVVHEASGLPADLVIAGPGLEEEFLRRAVTHEIEGVSVPVAAPEDIVVMKVLAARTKDFEDVVAILAAQGEQFDIVQARTVVQQLESALGQSDLTPQLDKAAARAKQR
jgi:hypothetical protein